MRVAKPFARQQHNAAFIGEPKQDLKRIPGCEQPLDKAVAVTLGAKKFEVKNRVIIYGVGVRGASPPRPS